jgi:hypothetical protein
MLNYRFYLIREDGHVAGPPQDFDFSDDYDAVKAPEKLVDGRDIEIWQSTRVVAYICDTPLRAFSFAARAAARKPTPPKRRL